MVQMLYAACRDVSTPVVQGTDVGRWVAGDLIIALTNPTGLCVWWGLHRLWTVRCQKAVRRMKVGTLSVVMALGVTFTEAQSWFINTEQQEAAHTAEMLSRWFWQHRQHMLGEDPAVNAARMRAVGVTAATVGQLGAHERRTRAKRKENARQRKQEGMPGPKWQRTQISGCQRS